MSSHDFSTIRWDRMRWDLVNAMAKAAEYHPGTMEVPIAVAAIVAARSL